MQALAAGCIAVGVTACGGSGSGDGAGGQLEIQAADAGDSSIGSGSLQTRQVVLHNGSSRVAKALRVQVALDAQVIQLPLACEAGTTAVCQVSADGALTIDQLAAGASITLQQQLRVKAGYRGAVSNAWTVSSVDAGLSAQWRQALTARVADVGLTMQSVTVSGADADRKLTYVLTISNTGPDEARGVVWNQTAGIDMPYQSAKCTAAGGAVCPASLGESIQVAQLPKGGSLSLELSYGGRSGAAWAETELLFSEVRAAGDSAPGNDRLLVRLADANPRFGSDGVYDLIDYEGHVGRLTLNEQPGSNRELRMESSGSEFVAGLLLDVTGFGVIVRSPADPLHLITDGTFQFASASNPIVGSFNFGQGLKPFLAGRDWITDLSELEGLPFTILGSQVDAAGRSLDAFARPARFASGTLSICEAATPTAVEVCPSSQLRQYAAALVGRELELMSSTQVMRLRALRTASGPVLVRSERTANDDGAMFWLGVPWPKQTRDISSPLQVQLSPATFASETGLAWPTAFRFSADAQDQMQFSSGGLPNSYLLFLQAHPEQQNTFCAIHGSAQPTAFAGLYEGNIDASSAFGASPPPCYQGPVYFAGNGAMGVLLGKKGGALGGRWLITTN